MRDSNKNAKTANLQFVAHLRLFLQTMVLGAVICLHTGCDDNASTSTAISERGGTTAVEPDPKKNKTVTLSRSLEFTPQQSGSRTQERVASVDPSVVTVGAKDRDSRKSFQSGMEHFANKRYVNAASAFRRVVLNDPGNTIAWYHLALAQLEQGNPGEAIFPLDQAIKRQPDMAEAWLARGVARTRQREFSKARADLEKASSLGQDSFSLYLHKAIVELNQNNLQAVIENATAATERDRNEAGPWFLRSVANARLGRAEAAEHDYQRMMALGADAAMQE